MAAHLASVLRPGDLFFYVKMGGSMSQAADGESAVAARDCVSSHRMVWCGAAWEDSTDSVLQFSGAL